MLKKITRHSESEWLVETGTAMSDGSMLAGLCVMGDEGLVPAPGFRVGTGVRVALSAERRHQLLNLRVGAVVEPRA